MALVRSFHRYRGESSFTLPRLIAILKEQLPRVAPEQTRYRVTTIPTERTIRFYTAQGLVDKPAGREGQLALYGYRHLLQVLAVKYLQSNYLPLRKIRSLVENATNRDLEQLMPEIAAANWSLRSLAPESRKVPELSDPKAPDRALPADRGPASAPGAAQVPAGATDGADVPCPVEPDTWHRLEVGPGIELHVHAAALSAGNRERLRGALLRELGVLRGWFAEAGKD